MAITLNGLLTSNLKDVGQSIRDTYYKGVNLPSDFQERLGYTLNVLLTSFRIEMNHIEIFQYSFHAKSKKVFFLDLNTA